MEKVFEGAAKDSTKPKIYTSYQDVYDDPDVDVVYVGKSQRTFVRTFRDRLLPGDQSICSDTVLLGTPHSLHKENCLSAIAANKHVLCEKPMTINAAESDVVIKAAKDKGVFLMEGESRSTLGEFHPESHGY